MSEFSGDGAWPAFQGALRSVIEALSPYSPPRAGLDALLTILVKDLGYARAHLTIFGDAPQSARISLSKSRDSGFGHLHGPGPMISGQVAVTKRAVIVENMDGHPDFAGRPPHEIEALSSICAPILHPKRHGASQAARVNPILGLISVDLARAPMVFLESHHGFLELVASIVGLCADRLESGLGKPESVRAERRPPEPAPAPPPASYARPLAASKSMRLVLRQAAQAALTAEPVLLRGEDGVGKEFLAQVIHTQGTRAGKPFVCFQGRGQDARQLSQALFGVQKSKSPGAATTRKGAFEQAEGGTLFIDDVDELPLSVQSGLLTALETGRITREGADKQVAVETRLILASTRPLEDLVSQGAFLDDLLYAVAVIPIFVPPLRDRSADILPLAELFLAEFSASLGKDIRRISTPAIDLLSQYHWPGNVRELKRCLEKAVAGCEEGVIRSYHLPPTLQTAESSATDHGLSFGEAVAGFEREMLVEALKKAGGNMFKAARDLRESYRIINYKVKKYGLDPKRFAQARKD